MAVSDSPKRGKEVGMKASIEQIYKLLDKNSQQSREKKAALTRKRPGLDGFMAPNFEGQPDALSHRISWETLTDQVASIKQRTVERMRRADVDAEKAEELQRKDVTYSVQIFVNCVLDMLSRMPVKFDPNNGFDLDLYLHVDCFGITNDATVLMEMFPRQRKGQLSTAYCSYKMDRAPLLTGGSVFEDSILRVLSSTESLRATEDLVTIADRWHEEQERYGHYRVKGQEEIDLFIHRCCESLLEEMGVERGPTRLRTGRQQSMHNPTTRAILERVPANRRW